MNLWLYTIRNSLALIIIVCVGACRDSGNTLFKPLDSASTGIDFNNKIQYTDSLSVLDFEFMFNGAGVAVGDFNNDDLLDIYFTGNMTSNRLFLNKGDWQYEDITESAGLLTTGWSNGVSLVDIDQDGFLDIYVSRGGPRSTDPQDRTNLLFINNGDLSFTESAAAYGLDNSEYTVQSAFFDYDLDGDLDVYLLSNALVNFNRNTSRLVDRSGKAPSVDKLLRNNGDETFTEVSQEAGVLIEGFGLGVEICDINEDQWPDIYVSNDFLTNDLLYINQQNGSFKNEIANYLKHQTYNGMGNDVADFNNDGLMDIVVLDMLPEDNLRRKLTMMGNAYDLYQKNIDFGYQPQYVRNTLQLNNGNSTFSEIGQLSGIDATDWSWSALFADYDNDGYKDLFVTNGYRKDVTNLDFIVYGQQVLTMGEAEANRQERLKALNEIPGAKIPNYVFRNMGDLTFTNTTEEWGMDRPSYSNGAVYADLDNDGDLDLVVSNLDEQADVYRNQTRERLDSAGNYIQIKFEGPPGNLQGLGTKIRLYYDTLMQYQYFTPYRGYLSSIDPKLHFGLGQSSRIDSLMVTWPNGGQKILFDIDVNQVITVQYRESDTLEFIEPQHDFNPYFEEVSEQININYQHQENLFVDYKLQPILPHMHSRNGPGMAAGDIDHDGLEDFYVGGAAGYPGAYFTQNSDGTLSMKKMDIDSASEDMGVLLFDANDDAALDLYIASGGSAHPEGSNLYQDRFYLNDGQGNFTRLPGAIPLNTESSSCVVAGDYDRDGDLDLFVGGRTRPGSYPLPPQSFLLRNETPAGNKEVRFTTVTTSLGEAFTKMGMVTDALWTDFDNDGWLDLLVVGEFMPIRIYHNQQGDLVDITENAGLQHTSGWWNSLTAGDFDADGDMDYLVGNLGLNSRLKSSPEEPLCIYAKDYDNNGRIDPVMCYYIQGRNHVAHSRDDMIAQINAMRARFKTYDSYARTSFEESFLESELKDAYVVHSETFNSSYLENLGGGSFTIRSLPLRAQFAPVYGIQVADYNQDGHLDALLTGNFYASVVSTGKYDASIGLLMLGDGQGEFQVVSAKEAGIMADGDSKGTVQLVSSSNKLMVVVANNSGPLKVFSTEQAQEVIYALPTDSYALITTKEGQTYRQEFYHGSTYLSGSGRFIIKHPRIASITIFDQNGQARAID
ncbi:MAG: VCBS repeat-containing protein [Cyclobacteriaceae bacterium]|nr:VCBS repeat-containing protein [Cyclobacteriaceae bacterium]